MSRKIADALSFTASAIKFNIDDFMFRFLLPPTQQGGREGRLPLEISGPGKFKHKNPSANSVDTRMTDEISELGGELRVSEFMK